MDSNKIYVHPNALVEATVIGAGTRIWAFCNVQKDAKIGANCNVGDNCFIENNVIVGNKVTIKNGVSLWDGMVVEDNVFIGPNAAFTNDIYPRSQVSLASFAQTLIKKGATIGANATIVAGRTIGRYAFIGAGAVLTHDAPDFTIWYGNPARGNGFVCRCAKRLVFDYDSEHKNSGRAVCGCGLDYQMSGGLVDCLSAESA